MLCDHNETALISTATPNRNIFVCVNANLCVCVFFLCAHSFFLYNLVIEKSMSRQQRTNEVYGTVSMKTEFNVKNIQYSNELWEMGRNKASQNKYLCVVFAFTTSI